MTLLAIFVYFFHFLGVMALESVNPYQVSLCSHSQALNCYANGIKNDECTKDKFIGLKDWDNNDEEDDSLNFHDAFLACVSLNIKNFTSPEENEKVFVPDWMMVNPFEHVKFSTEFFKLKSENANYFVLRRACKIIIAYNCFIENNCYMKSHFKTLPNIYDVCQKESRKIVNIISSHITAAANETSSHTKSTKNLNQEKATNLQSTTTETYETVAATSVKTATPFSKFFAINSKKHISEDVIRFKSMEEKRISTMNVVDLSEEILECRELTRKSFSTKKTHL